MTEPATAADRDGFWQAILHEAMRAGTCWCGNLNPGHVGWLDCAQREVDRRAANTRLRQDADVLDTLIRDAMLGEFDD